MNHRNVDQIEDGGVVVLGASASGARISDELARAGHGVTMAMGHHTRIPRRYRVRDIFAWLEGSGILDDRWVNEPEIAKSRRASSLQLASKDDGQDLDLNALGSVGVRLTGRLVGVSDRRLQFSGSLANTIASADLKMHRLLSRIDRMAGHVATGTATDRPQSTLLPPPYLDLDHAAFTTIIWATGFSPKYPWLSPHLLDRSGSLVHNGGVITDPGMFALGLLFLRRRKSGFIEGAGRDATELVQPLLAHLNTTKRSRD